MGRDAARTLARRHGIALDQSRSDCLFGRGRVGAIDVIVAVPLRYMNESGRAVVPLSHYYKIPPEQMLLLYDDLDLPLGTLRVRQDGGSGGNRGAASVIQQLGTEAFLRVRIGIGRPPPGWDAADYVLARFAPDEVDIRAAALERAADAVESILADGAQSAMNAFN